MSDKLFRNAKILRQGNSNYVVESIKEKGKRAVDFYQKDTRMELSETLLNLHPFFKKVEKAISESIVLLGKLAVYLKGEVIVSDAD